MSERKATKFGVLLPHFGRHASREHIVDASAQLERAGFDSVWVRDHVVFRPHGHEGQDPIFWEPMITLAAVAAVTEKLVLGTGALIPYRHPLHTALLFGTLDRLAGPNRLILGMGLGSFDHEFAAVGMGDWDRRQVVQEQVEILRAVWSGQSVTHKGQFYSFSDAQVSPQPAGAVPIWYSGTSPASVRRAVEYCQGWIPGRMPRRDFRKRMARMRRLAEEADRPTPEAGAIPYVVPGRTMEEARKGLNIEGLLAETAARFSLPESGTWERLEDLDGALIAGPPDTIVDEVSRYLEAGVDHFVFDVRLRFDEWEMCLDLLSSEVLPELRRSSSPGTTR